MKKLFCICYLFLVLCGTFPWITSCSGDDVEEVVSVQDVPSEISRCLCLLGFLEQ